MILVLLRLSLLPETKTVHELNALSSMDLLRTSPFRGGYSNYELQEWIKALQQEAVQQRVMLDVQEKVLANFKKMLDGMERAEEYRLKWTEALQAELDQIKRAEQSPIPKGPLCLN